MRLGRQSLGQRSARGKLRQRCLRLAGEFSSRRLALVLSDFEVVDQAAFQKLFPKGAAVRKLAGDMKFVEGPVGWTNADGGYLVFSDIPASELKRWDAKNGLTTFRASEQSDEREHADLRIA